MSFAGTTLGMISSNKYNLGLLRKTSAYQNNRKYLSSTEIADGNIDVSKPLNLEDLKDVHTEKLSNLKYKIFFFAFIPWGIFLMWWMGFIG